MNKFGQKIYIIFLIVNVLTINLFSQIPYEPEFGNPFDESARWSEYPELDGKGVRCLAEDANGNMWFGLDSGVVSYDGYNWHNYSLNDGIYGSGVNSLCITRKGKIYAGTESGLSVFENNKWRKVFPLGDSIKFFTRQILELNDGSILTTFSCESRYQYIGGLYHLEGDKQTFYVSERGADSLLNTNIDVELAHLPNYIDYAFLTGLCQDKNNDIWFANSEMVLKVDLESLTRNVIVPQEKIDLPEGADDIYIEETSDGKLWVLSDEWDTEILIKDGNKWEYMSGLGNKYAQGDLNVSLQELPDGRIIVGGFGKVFYFNDTEWLEYKRPQYRIPVTRVFLYVSTKGVIWMAGLRKNVLSLDYSTEEKITYKDLNLHCESSDGRFWFISSDDRVVVKDGDEWYSYGPESGLMQSPSTIIELKGGMMWVGGSHHGDKATSYLEGNKWITKTYQLGWGVDYRGLYEDRLGRLFVGDAIDKRLDKNHGDYSILFPNPQEEPDKYEVLFSGAAAYGIAQSDKLETFFGGITLRYMPDPYDLVDNWSVIKNFNVDCLDDTKSGTVWGGSRTDGVLKYKDKKWTQFTKKDGLKSNTIISICALSDTNVWAITDKDICRFDGKVWSTDIFPLEYNFNREAAAIFIDSKNEVWISSSSREWKRRALYDYNLAYDSYKNFYTIHYRLDTVPPDTRITNYTDVVDKTGNVLISWGGNDYFERTAQDRLKYSYRLNGGKWSPFTPETNHTFLGLHSGEYILEVRSQDDDVNIDPTPATVYFKVLMPVWKRPWFILFVVVFLVVVGFYQVKLNLFNRKLIVLNESLENQTVILNDTNSQLEERQQIVEEQSEELRAQKDSLLEQAEELKKQKDVLEELNATKDKFSSIIAHDLKNPLNTLLGYHELLHTNFERYTLEKNKKIINTLYSSSKVLYKLVQNLLQWSRSQRNILPYVPKEITIYDVVLEDAMVYASQLEEKNISLKTNIKDKKLKVFVDIDMFSTIIRNIISNAIKFTHRDGAITITVTEKEDNILFEIADTGIGIPAKYIDKIFKIDRNYIMEGTENERGTGLGLLLCKDFVEKNKGAIWVNSIEGRGTTFSFTLPKVKAE